jgi:superfamily II DNA/RNA helicase
MAEADFRRLFASVRYIVLDEAERLLKPLSRYATKQEQRNRERHQPAAEQLVQRISRTSPMVQYVMLSATVNAPLRNLPVKLGWVPTMLPVASTNEQPMQLPAQIKHYVVRCSESRKPEAVDDMLRSMGKDDCVLLVGHRDLPLLKTMEHFRSLGWRVALVHQNMDTSREYEAFKEKMRDGAYDFALATEDGIRGLSLDFITHVVLLNVTPTPHGYLHAAGRTGAVSRPAPIVCP